MALKRMTEKEREGYNLLKVSSRDRHLLQRHKPLTKQNKKKPAGEVQQTGSTSVPIKEQAVLSIRPGRE